MPKGKTDVKINGCGTSAVTQLNCRVSGYPSVSVNWVKSTQAALSTSSTVDRLNFTQKVLSVVSDRPSIVIGKINVTRSTGGNYTCIASNGLEEASSTEVLVRPG